jgi:hypothetical protein
MKFDECIYADVKNPKICTIRIDGICNFYNKYNCEMFTIKYKNNKR